MLSSFPLLCERAGTAYQSNFITQTSAVVGQIENGGWPALNAAESTLHRLGVPRPSSARGRPRTHPDGFLSRRLLTIAKSASVQPSPKIDEDSQSTIPELDREDRSSKTCRVTVIFNPGFDPEIPVAIPARYLRSSRDDSFRLHNQASFTPAVRMPFSVKAGRGGRRSFRRRPDHAP